MFYSPFHPQTTGLTAQDFHVFREDLEQLLRHRIPGFQKLVVLQDMTAVNRAEISAAAEQKARDYFAASESDNSVIFCRQEELIFSLPGGGDGPLLYLPSADPYFTRKLSPQWLVDSAENIKQQFLLIKRAGTDPVTALYNEPTYVQMLKRLSAAESISVMLVELYPRARSAHSARLHTFKSVRGLQQCIGENLPLFHLGHHVFALISTSPEQDKFRRIGKIILRSLRREGFKKIHIGLYCSTKRAEDNGGNFGPMVSECAASALQQANTMGPFALCDYERLQHPETNPLRKPSRSLVARLRRKWRQIQSFSLVMLQPARKDDLSHLLRSFGDSEVVVDGEDFFVFLPGRNGEDALRWATQRIHASAAGDVLTGVAYYPHLRFSRGATVLNCRKAILHAAFLGGSGAVVVDGVSFNVSGDIYYSEGNLAAAVREYKLGLANEPDNINLLNSLGAVYAEMGNDRIAKNHFDKVLELDENNFMALFNAGLGEEARQESEAALRFFETALQEKDDFPEVVDELHFRLGKLYCENGQYGRSVDILNNLQRKGEDSMAKGSSLFYLGCSLYRLGRLNDATTWLQRALKYNEYDARAMSLLGVAYHAAGEGDDIALSLCRKGLEIEPTDVELKLNLARVQLGCGKFSEARETLRSCIRSRKGKFPAQILMCRCFIAEKKIDRAEYWYEKVRLASAQDDKLANELKKMSEELNDLRRQN